MPTYLDYPIRGFDISQNQDRRETPYLPDLARAKEVIGADFVGIRIGYGQVTDRMFPYFWKKAKEVHLERIPYFYLDYYSHKWLGISRSEWGKRQAAYGWALLQPDPGEVALHIDIEPSTLGGSINWLTAPGVMETAKAFRSEYERLSKGKLSLYESPSYLVYFDDSWKDAALWLALYNRTVTKASIDAMLAKYKWRNRAYIHQYASDGDIDNDGTKDGIRAGMESADLDLNVFLGSREEWSKYLGETIAAPTQPTIPEDQPAPQPMGDHTYRHAKVVCPSGLNIRALPGTSSAITGWVNAGEIVEVIQDSHDTAANPWGRIGHGQWCAIKYNNQTMMQNA